MSILWRTLRPVWYIEPRLATPTEFPASAAHLRYHAAAFTSPLELLDRSHTYTRGWSPHLHFPHQLPSGTRLPRRHRSAGRLDRSRNSIHVGIFISMIGGDGQNRCSQLANVVVAI